MNGNKEQQRQFSGYQGQQGARSSPERSQQQGGYASRQGTGSTRQGTQSSYYGGQQQAFGGQSYQNVADVALRGTALLWDLQMETMRSLWRTQARTAAMLGAPDYSELLHIGDDSARRIFSATAEQVLNSARQARDAVVEVQREIGRLAQQHTIGIAEEMRERIEQMGRETQQSLQEFKHMAISQTERLQAEARDEYGQRYEGDERATSEYASAREGQGDVTAQAQGETREAAEEARSTVAEQATSSESGETRREERSRRRS